MKGLRLDHGYVQIRVHHEGRLYHCENFGKDSPMARQIAEMKLAQIRAKLCEEKLLGKVGLKPELPRKRFRDLVPVFLKLWSDMKDRKGRVRQEKSILECGRVLEKTLMPYFGDMWFDEIKPINVERWYNKRLETGILDTSASRELVPLSSMFTVIARSVELERIPKFRLPEKNPCDPIQRASVRKRTRLLSEYELRKIHLACTTLADNDAWGICKLALKSILSEKDLRTLELGSTIDLDRSKTGVPVHIPITVLQKLNWKNWRRRWKAIRKEAGLLDIQFRDLRKTGGNYLIGKFDTKLVSQYFGHASVKTTEQSYTITQHEKMRPLAEASTKWVEGL